MCLRRGLQPHTSTVDIVEDRLLNCASSTTIIDPRWTGCRLPNSDAASCVD